MLGIDKSSVSNSLLSNALTTGKSEDTGFPLLITILSAGFPISTPAPSSVDT